MVNRFIMTAVAMGILVGLFTPLSVRGAPVNIGTVFGPANNFKTVGSLTSVILWNAVIGAGIVFLFLMIGGGISIIAGAGGGDKNKVGQGQKAVTAALIGFVVVFASYWILQILGVITGVNILGR